MCTGDSSLIAAGGSPCESTVLQRHLGHNAVMKGRTNLSCGELVPSKGTSQTGQMRQNVHTSASIDSDAAAQSGGGEGSVLSAENAPRFDSCFPIPVCQVLAASATRVDRSILRHLIPQQRLLTYKRRDPNVTCLDCCHPSYD